MAAAKTFISVTAFLDILGFGNRVLMAKNLADVQAISSDVRTIQKAFDYKSNDKVVRENQSLYGTTVLAFSDSVIVNIPLQSKMTNIQGTFDALMSEVHSMALAQAECVNKGLFLRGGVDLGWWHQIASTLVSQSMVRAYKMESATKVPVIGLTFELHKFFLKHKDRHHYSKHYDPARSLFRPYREGGKTKFWFLDYMTAFVNEIDGVATLKERKEYLAKPNEERDAYWLAVRNAKIRSWLALHAKRIQDAHSQANEASVKEKYEWLAKYHNTIARRFSRSREVLCVLN